MNRTVDSLPPHLRESFEAILRASKQYQNAIVQLLIRELGLEESSRAGTEIKTEVSGKEPDFVTLEEAAQRTGYTARYLKRLVREGKISSVGKRKNVRVSVAEILSYQGSVQLGGRRVAEVGNEPRERNGRLYHPLSEVMKMPEVMLSSSRIAQLAQFGLIDAFQAYPRRKWYVYVPHILKYQGEKDNRKPEPDEWI